jgi:hypothetical protein
MTVVRPSWPYHITALGYRVHGARRPHTDCPEKRQTFRGRMNQRKKEKRERVNFSSERLQWGGIGKTKRFDERNAWRERQRERDRQTAEYSLFLRRTLPAVFFDHVCHFDYVLALLVLLAGFEGVFVFPTQGGLAAFTVYVGDRM